MQWSFLGPGPGFDITYSYVKLQDTFTSNNVEHTVENYRTSLVGKKITGATSKVVAKIVGTSAGDTTDPLTIFVKFESSDTGCNWNFKYRSRND